MAEDYIDGRGAQLNPHNRFLSGKRIIEDWEGVDECEGDPAKTRFIDVFPKTIVNEIKSPDLRMAYSANPYQGCEHGCTYCYARPTHEYWGYSAGLDFERVILVKKNAPELMEQTILKKSWKVRPISLSGNTDCYQPCEKQYGITRRLLEVMLKYRHPVGIITKNALLNRDIDILTELAKLNLVNVYITITSLNEELRRKLEPRTATAKRKLDTIERFTANGIPVGIMMAPIIPGLNDHEIFSVIKAAGERGALSAAYTIARLNGPNGEIFTDWVTKNYPDRASKVLNQLREIHGGTLSDSRFGLRMSGEGNYAINIRRQFEMARRTYMKDRQMPVLNTDLFRGNDHGQLNLFDA
jgi:DNA repair photolyase